MKLYFLLDPLESLRGPAGPPFLIAKGLESFSTVFASPMVRIDVAEVLKSNGFNILNLGKRFCSSGSLLTMEGWLRQYKFGFENVNQVTVNFSQCFLADAHIYYAQGPMTKALDDMYPEMKRTHRLAYCVARPFFVERDKGFVKRLRDTSKLFIANSRFCAHMYEEWGVKVDDVIYPPLDCEKFQPFSSKPCGDYVLTYIGKEVKYSVLKAMAEAGIKIKVFGSKASYVPKYMLKQPNIEFQGGVSDKKLVSLYSNALFTLFPFTHEPFGYIPVESMACGTPVLTYNKQGPSESIINGETGWLAGSDKELVNTATTLWRQGYLKNIRSNCRRRALKFDVKIVATVWLKLIQELFDNSQKKTQKA